MSEGEDTAASWYEATRVTSPEHPRLNFDLDVDVCVIGAGLAGLTVAREVAKRKWSVAVLEAHRVAWEASGRNTGFVLPGVARGPVWPPVSKLQDDDPTRREVERMRWIGANVEAWPTERVREVLPNPRYFGALHFPGAIHIHPLNYALGLAADAQTFGLHIFEHTPAIAIDPAGVRKRIETRGGMVRAAHVVLACNVQLSDLMPQLGATLLPISTFVLVPEPLGPILHEVVRYRGAVSDTNRADNHYRVVGVDRLQWSGTTLSR